MSDYDDDNNSVSPSTERKTLSIGEKKREVPDYNKFFDPSERTLLLVDGPNFFATTKDVDINIDYIKFVEYFSSKTKLIRAYYYSIFGDGNRKKFLDWMSYNGYTVYAKEASGEKTTLNVEIATDAILYSNHCDHFVIVSGAGEFSYLVDKLKSLGKRVTVVSTYFGDSPYIADDLRKSADQFIDLFNIEKEVVKKS